MWSILCVFIRREQGDVVKAKMQVRGATTVVAGSVCGMVIKDVVTAICEVPATIRHTANAVCGAPGAISYTLWGNDWWKAPILIPLLPLYGLGLAFWYLVLLCARLAGTSWFRDDDDIGVGAMEVPTFYAGDLSGGEKWLAGSAGLITASIFGAIHCVAWSFEFPSHAERLLWHVSSVVITCLPLAMLAI